MLRADRLTRAIRGHRLSIGCLSAALVLTGAGTASAATVAPAAAIPASAITTAPARTALAATLLARTGPARSGPGRTVLAKTVLARAGRPGSQQPVTFRLVRAALNRQANPALAARGIIPSADRLLPVSTAGPQNFMPISPAQYANATTIVRQALARKMGVRSAVIAVATAMQESRLQDLGYGTGDSLGLFQQQYDMGWGTARQIMNPAYASDEFLTALRAYQASDPGWASQPLYQCAQGVQRSGFPFAYAQWESQAAQLTASIALKVR
jgi:hypothetical protein